MTDISGPTRPDLREHLASARKLEWLSLLYLCSTIAVLVLVMAGSQALKTEFVGDALSMIAPILFLIGNRISAREPSEDYPFGYERATSAGYLGAAIVLLATGAFLFCDSALKLVFREHPIIGGMPLFGRVVWIGWLAIPALLWSSLPAFFLGRAKTRIAHRIHDKILLADAQTNAADWQSAGAAILGVVGIALGYWWADALAALLISSEILRSGWQEVRSALGEIMDRRPQQLGSLEVDPLPEKLTAFLRGQDWIEDAVVRMRERGREFVADGIVVPRDEDGIVEKIAQTSREALKLDDRLRDVALTPVRRLSEELQQVRADQP